MTTTVTYSYICDCCHKEALPAQNFPYTNKDSLAFPRSLLNIGGDDICPECKVKFDEWRAARKAETAAVVTPKVA